MKKTHLLLAAVFLLALFLRSYRTEELLGFWYDQGRDAKIIWHLWHSSKLFLIGPVTGIDGIFLGPFYYYFIAPFYLISRGDPVVPSLWLSLVTSLSVILIYKMLNPYQGHQTAIIAAFLYAFSSSLVQYNRWLSNPTPLPFFSLLAFYALMKIIFQTPGGKYPLLLGLCVGLSLQLEAASATFFLPAIIVILSLFYQSLNLSKFSFILMALSFAVTLLPQIIFNFRHGNILFNSLHRFLVIESSFKPQLAEIITRRLQDYFGFFFSKLFLTDPVRLAFAVFLVVAAVVLIRKSKSKIFAASFIWWFTPLLFLAFYHGNSGFVWDYYFTGVYPMFIISVGLLLGWSLRRGGLLRLAAAIFLLAFTVQNFSENQRFLSQKSTAYISLATINSAVDWVYNDASRQKFNVDVYLAPVISHSYDYVFLWRGSTKFNHLPAQEMVPLLYTLLEPDWERPHLRQSWLNRQDSYGQVVYETQINQVLIQRRHRYQ